MTVYSSLFMATIVTCGLSLTLTVAGAQPASAVNVPKENAPSAISNSQAPVKEIPARGASLSSSSSSSSPAATPPIVLRKGWQFAEAKLEAKSGSSAAGTVTFIKHASGIKVGVDVSGVTPGVHGFHIHEKGDCSAPDAASAGGHFNPSRAAHADPFTDIRHVGDLGNIEINSDGKGVLNLIAKDPKGFSDWAEIVGKSVILHEKADDLKTQPTGNAGKRIACGVIGIYQRPSH